MTDKKMTAVMDVDWVTFTCPCGESMVWKETNSCQAWINEHKDHTDGTVSETVTPRGQLYLPDRTGVREYPIEQLLKPETL